MKGKKNKKNNHLNRADLFIYIENANIRYYNENKENEFFIFNIYLL